VRVRTNPGNDAGLVFGALQKEWPLAKASVHENALDGTTEAEIVMPRTIEERRKARKWAKASVFAIFVFRVYVIMLCASIVSYGVDYRAALLAIKRPANTTTTTTTAAAATTDLISDAVPVPDQDPGVRTVTKEEL
jgi:hypothetical protein